MIDPRALRIIATGVLALSIAACCAPPDAEIRVERRYLEGIHPDLLLLTASTTPNQRVTVTGFLSFGAESSFTPDTLDNAAIAIGERNSGLKQPAVGWLFSTRGRPLPALDRAKAEAKRLGMDDVHLNLHVRLTGRFRYLSVESSGYDREFVVDDVDRIIICPMAPASFKGCDNNDRAANR